MEVTDDAVFNGRKVTGMALGAHENGNLRAVLTLEDGSVVPVEWPHAWLHGELGFASFMASECHPSTTVGGRGAP